MNKKFSLLLRAAMVLSAVLPASLQEVSAKDPLPVPYTETFASDHFKDFTVIDSNGDGTVWKYRQNFDDLDAAYIDTQGVSTDDWLILPGVALDPANLYKLSFTLHGMSYNYNECAELYIGTSPEVSAMTKQVVSVVDMYTSRQTPLTESGTFSVSEAGTYYIGIHASSGYKRYGIFVLGVELTVDRPMATPAEVSGFTVSPDLHGALQGVITLTAPAASVQGQPLSGTVDIEVLRDDAVVHTVSNVAPGAQVRIDEAAPRGNHTYRAFARNECGEGVSVTAEAFFGFDLPKAPAAITVKETETNGKVLVTWQPVTEDVNGKILPADDISYKLYGPGGTVIVSKIRDTQYTATATKGTQMFANYGVTTITSQGEGEEFILSEIIPVGDPYPTPWTETCAEGEFSSIIRFDDLGGYMRTGIYSSVDTELEDADGSGYYLIARAYDPDTAGRLYTGKIDLRGTTYPALSFSYYALPGTLNTVEVLASDGNDWKSLKTLTLDGADSDWVSAFVDLSEYRGKWVEFAFEATVKTHISIALDNFAVTDRPAVDLSLSAFTAPETMKVGQDGNFSVTVTNNGGTAVSDFTVRLSRNGDVIASQRAERALAPGQNVQFGFADCLGVTAPENNVYMMDVVAEGDANAADNSTASKSVATIQPVYPYVTSLAGSVNNGEVTLTWDEADMETMVFEPITESFESCTNFAIDSCDGWSFIDGDQSKTYYLEDFEFPSQGSAMAAIVLPSSYFSGWKNFDSHSGGKMLASFSAVNGPNDDWMISPELIGDEQTVSFFAKSMSSVYPDAFEFYYSTSGTDRRDFIQMGEEVTAPNSWTEYSYDLPEGAKYFAVRYISGDGFVFMMDDFRFIPESAKNLMDELALVGYNVYRDNVLINAAPLDDPGYLDNSAEDGVHTWQVTSVYLQGESRLGNPVTLKVDRTGVAQIFDAKDTEVKYFDMRGIRVMQPKHGEIYIEVRGGKATKRKF